MREEDRRISRTICFKEEKSENYKIHHKKEARKTHVPIRSPQENHHEKESRSKKRPWIKENENKAQNRFASLVAFLSKVLGSEHYF